MDIFNRFKLIVGDNLHFKNSLKIKYIDNSHEPESMFKRVNNRIFDLFYYEIKYLMKLPVYFDNSATTPCDAAVIESMLPFFGAHYGNPASHFHRYGWEAEEAVAQARTRIAHLIGSKQAEIIFTSGATESCNLALKGVIDSSLISHPHIITLSTEHRAVLETVKLLQERGCLVTTLGVNSRGLPDLNELEDAIRPSTLLIAAMYANNETGVIHPVKEIACIARSHGVLFFSDATQAVGKIPVSVMEDGIDIMAFTAHKMYGPKGVGALYKNSHNRQLKIRAQMSGGKQERGYRGGTLNVPGIVGFGKAAQLADEEPELVSKNLVRMRNKLEKALLELPGVYLNGDPENRLPHITNISIEEVDGERLLFLLSSKLAFSSGAACSSSTREPSHVLQAMGISPGLLHNSVRLSQGRYTTDAEIDFAIEEIGNAITGLRAGVLKPANSRLQPSSFSGQPG
jgi:cysteine desulfurase